MVREVALENDLSRDVSAAGAAGDLREKLEGPLRGAEVRETQADVGVDHAHERDSREVVSFGDHLRADEDVGLAGLEAGEDARHRAATPRGVTIAARHSSLGE